MGSEPSVFPQSWLHVLVAALQRMPVDRVHSVRPHIQKAGLGTVPFVKAQTGAERHRQTRSGEHLAPTPLSHESDAARLLQFSTGTARMPVQGFKLLQGRDGDVRKFTITHIKVKESIFPKAVSREVFRLRQIPCLFSTVLSLSDYLTCTPTPRSISPLSAAYMFQPH